MAVMYLDVPTVPHDVSGTYHYVSGTYNYIRSTYHGVSILCLFPGPNPPQYCSNEINPQLEINSHLSLVRYCHYPPVSADNTETFQLLCYFVQSYKNPFPYPLKMHIFTCVSIKIASFPSIFILSLGRNRAAR